MSFDQDIPWKTDLEKRVFLLCPTIIQRLLILYVAIQTVFLVDFKMSYFTLIIKLWDTHVRSVYGLAQPRLVMWRVRSAMTDYDYFIVFQISQFV